MFFMRAFAAVSECAAFAIDAIAHLQRSPYAYKLYRIGFAAPLFFTCLTDLLT